MRRDARVSCKSPDGTVQVYDNAKAAAKELGINPGVIYRSIRNGGLTRDGDRWSFVGSSTRRNGQKVRVVMVRRFAGVIDAQAESHASRRSIERALADGKERCGCLWLYDDEYRRMVDAQKILDRLGKSYREKVSRGAVDSRELRIADGLYRAIEIVTEVLDKEVKDDDS